MRSEWVARRSNDRVKTQMVLRPGGRGHRGDRLRGGARAASGGAGPRRGGARSDGHPGQREPHQPRADGHRHRARLQDQREHRQQRRSPPTSTSELEKLALCLKYGADTVMDLSTGGNIHGIREAIIARRARPDRHRAHLPGLVARRRRRRPDRRRTCSTSSRQQAQQGVDYMTIHAGRAARLHPAGGAPHHRHRLARRRADGAVDARQHGKENPLYTHFDEILRDLQASTTSPSPLGDGLRPGCLADASDDAQFAELKVLGELTKKAWAHDVQVMMEGPGHVPLDQIAMNMEKRARALPRGALLRARPAGHRHRPRLRPHHQRHRRRDGGSARRGRCSAT